MIMKRIITYLIPLSIVILSGCRSDIDKALSELDDVMAEREIYRQMFYDRTDALRTMYEKAEGDSLKWEYANDLFYEYIHFNLDSAYMCQVMMSNHNVTPQQTIRSSIAEVNILSQKHMYALASEAFNAIDREMAMSGDVKKDYLACALYLYKNMDQDTLNMYRESYLREDTVSVFGQKIHAQYLRDKGQTQRALDILLACDGTEDNYHDKTSTVYNIGMLYDMLGNKDKKILYLARSGIYDFLAPNRDYMSIYQLALELYDGGDLRRANRYIETNLMDVIEGGFDHRIINAGKAHTVIAEATQDAERDRTRIITAALVIVTVFLVIIGWMLYYSRKQSRRLKESHRLLSIANNKAKERNIKLREANLIKDNYVFRYMELSIKYLEKLEKMRHDIRQELKKKPLDEVMKELHSPSEIYAEYKNYYQVFDETFLGIFPEFRENVNALLREECRIPVPEEKVLSTELRILAVIRLGISESGKIASFLKCAPATIYTYRTKMRNAAMCSKDEFEDKVRHL